MSDMLGSANDFDFEIGQWNVSHRRLTERLSGCETWEEFAGTASMQTVLGGNGNIEDNVLELPNGTQRAIAVRSFDHARKSWAIWWLSSQDPHRLDVPVIGRFKDGVGSFFADDTLRGLPVKVRFLWLRTGTSTPRWEQALSNDQCKTWETNWTMDFSRA